MTVRVVQLVLETNINTKDCAKNDNYYKYHNVLFLALKNEPYNAYSQSDNDLNLKEQLVYFLTSFSIALKWTMINIEVLLFSHQNLSKLCGGSDSLF